MKNKILSLVFASTMIAGAIMPVTALTLDSEGNSVENVEYNENVTESGQATVDAQVKSSYKVTLPKAIVISGTTKKASYYVKVEGDLSDSQFVRVTPASKVELNSTSSSANKKGTQEGIISQDKTDWYWDNIDTDAVGTITADGLSAGKWTGKFAFNIELKEIQ